MMTVPPTPLPDDVARHRSWWVTALVDGGYRQGHGALRVDDETGSRFCCLGVAEDLRRGRAAWLIPNRPAVDHVGSHELPDGGDRNGIALTKATSAWLGLTTDNPTLVYRDHDGEDGGAWLTDTLAELNDSYKFDLVRIAAVIADQPADWTGDTRAAERDARFRNQRDYPEDYPTDPLGPRARGDHDYDEGDDPTDDDEDDDDE